MTVVVAVVAAVVVAVKSVVIAAIESGLAYYLLSRNHNYSVYRR